MKQQKLAMWFLFRQNIRQVRQKERTLFCRLPLFPRTSAAQTCRQLRNRRKNFPFWAAFLRSKNPRQSCNRQSFFDICEAFGCRQHPQVFSAVVAFLKQVTHVCIWSKGPCIFRGKDSPRTGLQITLWKLFTNCRPKRGSQRLCVAPRKQFCALVIRQVGVQNIQSPKETFWSRF